MYKYLKFPVKVRNSEKVQWTHFSYVPRELKQEFLRVTAYRGWTTNDWIEKWSKADFGIKRIDVWDDLYTLRKAIKDKYRQLYPEIHEAEADHDLDKHGWIRTWVVGHMKEEIEACKKK